MNRWHTLPAEIYTLAEQTPATVLLECAKPSSSSSCSRLFVAPLRVCMVREAGELPALFAEIESAVAAGYCVAGYFSYECGAFFEPSVAQSPCLSQRPDAQLLAWFGIYERCFLFDHHAGKFVGAPPPGLGELRLSVAESPSNYELQASIALSRQQYEERIVQILELIRAGDIYQLNFTTPINIHATGSKAALYRALSRRQPVTFGAFLHTEPERQVLSFSPELFFDLDESGAARHIITRPMKGTAPRGRTTAEDREIAAWLANDEKNRAENLMIVDLLRNDLGRLCKFGSVRVDDLFSTERYQTLWQMTSTVSGELRPDVSYQQIFRALFPCGSITGAPKVRAMQLIANLEERPRGVTTGAIGFFSAERTIFSVAIRTLELDGDTGSMGVGSGIVIDSNAADEWRECLLKAEFLLEYSEEQDQEKFSLIETLLWQNGYPLIELHLDRLEDSAAYFDIPCDREEIKTALLSLVCDFVVQQPRKVRLLLGGNGGFHIEHEPLIASTAQGRVYISTNRIDPNDRMLFHKTTCRTLYAKAYKEAAQAGFDEVLFLNERAEVTEGAISNLFIEKDSRWITPPISSGVLPGVYRRHLLETRPNIEERVLFLEDLRGADAIYLSNAVRGLRQISMNWDKVSWPDS